jgi:ABC-type glycerol-3-phosphate transport system substrate-binding protein
MKRLISGTTVLLLGMLFTLNVYARGSAGGQIQSGPVTLMTNYTGVGKIDHGLAWHFLLEDLGIEIDRTAQTREALQVAIAGGNLPDFLVRLDTEQFFQAAEAGLLVNLDDYKDKLPHVFANIAAGLEYNRDAISSRTGGALTGVYAVPEGTTNLPGWDREKYDVGPYLRWDYYYQMGYPELNTIDDYIPLVKAMLERFPLDENGRANLGFSFVGNGDKDSGLLSQATLYSKMHGQLTEKYLEIDVARNTTRSIFDDDSYYKKGLQFLFNANQAGVLDPNSMTQTFDAWHEKTATGRILAHFTAYSWTNFYNEEKERQGIYYGFVPFLTEKIPNTAQAPRYTPGSPGGFAISAKTKYLDKCLALLDYICSYDGHTKLYYGLPGIEGGVWDLVNGKPVPRGTFNPNTGGVLFISGGAGYPLYSSEYQQVDVRGILATNVIHPAWGESLYYLGWDSWKQPLDLTNLFIAQRMEVYGKYGIGQQGHLGHIELARKMGIELAVPPYTMEAVPENIAIINGRVGDATVTASWQMVLARNQAEFDRIWNELKTQVNGIGVGQSVQWYREAYQKGRSTVQKYVDIWNNTKQLQ